MKLTNQTKFKETELELIPKDWDVFTIPDIAENFDTKRAPLSSRQRAEMRGPYPYYGATGVLDYLNDYKLEGSYLLIAEDGTVTVDGKRPMLQRVSGKFWVSNHAHILKCKSDQDQEFLFYQLSATDISPYITGAVQLKLSQANLNKIPILWPQKKEDRKEIAEVLGALDEKIELNRKMNKTLESLARAVFKKWFIDDANPNWETKKLGDVVRIKYGKNLPTTKLQESGYPVFGGNGQIGFFDKYLYELPQVLVACRGAASGKVNFSLPKSFVTNNSLILEYDNILNYEFLKYFALNADFYSCVSGSAQPQITIESLDGYEIMMPSKEIIYKFGQVAEPITQKILLNDNEINTLSQIRDSLLPRLMSGKLRVK